MLIKPGLYLVATPIGNLDDITIRAINILKSSDYIFCEDTRSSIKLLQKHNINTKLKLYNDHSTAVLRNKIANYLDQEKIISLISDAGSPLISDPGYKLVRELREKNYHIDVLPGPCSPIAALSLSSLATDKFLFAGFLPKTNGLKIKFFEEFKNLQATLIFFETAPRLILSLKIALEIFGDRTACVAREITKLFQDIQIERLSGLIDFYTKNPPKGEIILLISRLDYKDLENNILISEEDIIKELKKLTDKGNTTKNAIDILYNEHNKVFTRKQIYKIANNFKINKN